MYLDYLKPVSNELQQFARDLNSFTLGNSISFKEDFLLDDIKNQSEISKIAIIGLQETRSDENDSLEDLNFDLVRRQFYQLYKGNWNSIIYDFGDLIALDTKQESSILFTKVLTGLIKNKYEVIVLGGNPSLAYNQCLAYKNIVNGLNYFSIDEKIRIGNELITVNEENYLSKIITTEDISLFNYCNLGYQTYFVAQETLDLIEQLNYDAVRLGELTQDITEAEHYIRDSHAGMINLSSIESNCFASTNVITPNGFNTREICALGKYIGTANNLTSIYIANYSEKFKIEDHLTVSQVIWYIIEGKNNKIFLKNIKEEQYLEKFIVPTDVQDYVFYRHQISNQWWMEIKDVLDNDLLIIPCSSKEYNRALEGEIPNKWWKFYKKFY